jgi:hypothetical protein
MDSSSQYLQWRRFPERPSGDAGAADSGPWFPLCVVVYLTGYF